MAAFTPTTQEVAIQEWLKEFVDKYYTAQDIPVIYERQQLAHDDTRPEKPYLTLYVITEVQEAYPELKTTDTASGDFYEAKARQYYAGTVSVNAWGDNASVIIRKLSRTGLVDPDLRVIAHSAGLNFRFPLPITPSRELRDTAWEGRAMCDFRYGFVETDSDLLVMGLEQIEATIDFEGLTDVVTAP